MMGRMVAAVADLHPSTLDGAADWYAAPPPPWTFHQVHPAVLATAWDLSGRDWHRVVLAPDHRPGQPAQWCLIVHNRAVW